MSESNRLKARITYDEQGRTIDDIIMDIYEKILIPKSREILDTVSINMVKLNMDK